jgi:hypothetical protein
MSSLFIGYLEHGPFIMRVNLNLLFLRLKLGLTEAFCLCTYTMCDDAVYNLCSFLLASLLGMVVDKFGIYVHMHPYTYCYIHVHDIDLLSAPSLRVSAK